MAFLTELWLPILLSAVFVFIVSSIIHMVLPYHASDYRKLQKEDALMDFVRSQDVASGAYMFPCAESKKDWKDPELIEKFKTGPVGWITVLPPGGFNMGKSLMWWFINSLIVGTLVAYGAWYGLGATEDCWTVFRVTGAAGLLGYSVGNMHDSIWKGQSWGVTMKFIFDGIIYGLVTAATFGWLWPDGVPSV